MSSPNFRYTLTNDPDGITETKHFLQVAIAGDITSDASYPIGFAPEAGVIKNVYFGVLANGTDANDPLTLSASVLKNGTAVCSTLPAIAKGAGTGAKSTYAAATGITQAVLKTDSTIAVAKGDQISVALDITKTTPDTDYNGATVLVEIWGTAS